MYFVVLPSGEKFGPADQATLQQWIQENRLNPQTILEDSVTGVQIPASSIPGLRWPNAAPPQATPPGGAYDYSQPRNTGPGGHYYRGDQLGPGQPLPSQYRKFNWGAFLFNWIWGLNHKKPILLVILGANLLGYVLPDVLSMILSLASFAACIYIGIKGNEWAWESGRFHDPEDMQRCQNTWGWWGLGIILLCCGSYAVLFAAMGATAFSR